MGGVFKAPDLTERVQGLTREPVGTGAERVAHQAYGRAPATPQGPGQRQEPYVRPAPSQPYFVGEPNLDNYIQQRITDPNVLHKMQAVPLEERRRWIMSAIEQRVERPEGWVVGCYKKWLDKGRMRDIARHLQHAPEPYAMVPAFAPAAASAAAPVAATMAAPPLALPALPAHPAAPPDVRMTMGPPAPVQARVPQAPLDDIMLSQPVATAPATRPRVLVPAWVREALALSQNEKRKFLLTFTKQLAGETQGTLNKFSPAEQVLFAWAALHLPSCWENPDKTVKQLLQTHGQLLGEQGPAPNLVEAFVLVLKPIFHCAGIGSALWCLSQAIGQIRDQLQVKVEGAWSFEIDQISCAVEARLAIALDIPLEQLGDVETWPQLVQENLACWQKRDFVLASISSTPCTNITPANQKMAHEAKGAQALHTAPSNLIFAVHHGEVIAQGGLEKGRFAYLSELPDSSSKEVEETVTGLHGVPWRLDSHQTYGLAKRTRHCRASPCLLEVPRKLSWKFKNESIGDWVWKGNEDGTTEYCHTVLRSHIPHLLEKQMFGDALEQWERSTLANIRMRSLHSGEERYISREFWYLWMGMADTALQTALDEVCPCLGHIFPNGAQAKAEAEGAMPCGLQMYCTGCVEVFERIGRAWECLSFTDALAQWLLQCAAARQGGDSTPRCFALDSNKMHCCGADCPLKLGGLPGVAAG